MSSDYQLIIEQQDIIKNTLDKKQEVGTTYKWNKRYSPTFFCGLVICVFCNQGCIPFTLEMYVALIYTTKTELQLRKLTTVKITHNVVVPLIKQILLIMFCFIVKKKQKKKTNRPDFFMVCTLIDHRNDATKCSKLGSETTRLRLTIPLDFRTFCDIYSLQECRPLLNEVER